MKSGNKIIFILAFVLTSIILYSFHLDDHFTYHRPYSKVDHFDWSKFSTMSAGFFFVFVGVFHTFGVVFGRGIKKLLKDWVNEDKD